MSAAKTETVEIKHLAHGAVLFSCEVKAGLPADEKLGAAVHLAVKAGTSLDGANLAGARLDGASLNGAILNGARLVAASLNGAILNDAILNDANLVGARLDGASLIGASLIGASLSGASLARASLVGANLDGANLDGANLDGANLSGANLDGARLDNARLSGARLDNAIGIVDCGAPYGWRVVVVKHKDGIRIGAGCRWFKYSTAVDHWTGRADRERMPPLLDYIKAAARINGWKLED